ncbi:hypothetical protein R3P38DRAFT_3581987 [Favolaschia claudopus]|uniref:Uncharacterized protein n=1 Tax=Favolaschia claudopus TaxID=2862362 RepID=A0AAW0AJS5_9AGAR
MKHKEKYPGIGKTPPLIFLACKNGINLKVSRVESSVPIYVNNLGLQHRPYVFASSAAWPYLQSTVGATKSPKSLTARNGQPGSQVTDRQLRKAINPSRDIAYGPFEAATGLESESAIRTYHLPRIKFGESSDKNLNKVGRLEGVNCQIDRIQVFGSKDSVAWMLPGFSSCCITDKNVSSAVLGVASPYGTMRGTLRVDVGRVSRVISRHRNIRSRNFGLGDGGDHRFTRPEA